MKRAMIESFCQGGEPMFIEPNDKNEPKDHHEAALYRIAQAKDTKATSLNLADLMLGTLLQQQLRRRLRQCLPPVRRFLLPQKGHSLGLL